MFTYPSSYLDGIEATAAQLGNFLPDTYGGSKLVRDYLRGASLVEQQVFNNTVEAQDTLGSLACPLFHTEQIYKLKLQKSEQVPGTFGFEMTYPLPENTWLIPVLQDAISEPIVSMANEIDYYLDTVNQKIVFRFDPFLNPQLIQNPVGELTLWAIRARFDTNYLVNHVTSIIGINSAPPNQAFKDMVNAAISAYAGATSYATVARFVAGMTDVPIVSSDDEEVTDIFSDATHLVISTNLKIYKFKLGSIPIVAVGDVLQADDQLVDTVQIFENNRGQVPGLPSLTLDVGFLLPNLTGPLTFTNASTPLVVTLNVLGFTKLTWALGGAGADVTQFFTDLHARGVANGATLANYMDLRPQPQPTQPDANSLPATINPMTFLFENVLRANAFIIKMNTTLFGADAPGLAYSYLIRTIVPPHSTAILLT
jgi:hypothetical protein